VVVLDSVITHTSAWFLDREIHQLVKFTTTLKQTLLKPKYHSIFNCSLAPKNVVAKLSDC